MTSAGLALIDKPQGFTSHDVVAKLRGVLGTRKVGHAGTLDPMATGLLVVGVGAGTKLMTYLTGADKSYLATFRLGVSTFTDDAEGETTAVATKDKLEKLDSQQILSAVREFEGVQLQLPSKVSAKKIGGKKAYELAREGKEFELKPVEIEIYKIKASQPRFGEYIDLDIEVECSSGTFIRAIARDLGEKLGVGAHLTKLRRTKVGPFSVENATNIENATPMKMTDAAAALLPVISVSEQEQTELTFGRALDVESEFEHLAAINGDRLVAIVSGGKKLSPKTVFND